MATTRPCKTLRIPNQVAGSYLVCQTVTDACGTDSTCATVEVDQIVALEQGQLMEVTVYPVPGDQELQVELVLSQNEDVILSIYNAVGQVVVSRTFEMVSQKQISLDVSELPSGPYHLEIRTHGETVVRKIGVIH